MKDALDRLTMADQLERERILPDVAAMLRMTRKSANAVLDAMKNRQLINVADGPLDLEDECVRVVTLPDVHELNLEQIDALAFLLRHFPGDLEPD